VGGLARAATQIARWRAANPNSLLVDLGDLYQGHPLGARTRAGLMPEILNALRYDAWVIGNHEFDWGPEVLAEATKRSRMPVLAANVRMPEELARELRVAPFILRDVAGFRVAVIGCTTPGMRFWLPSKLLGGFEATDPVDAVRAALLEVRALKADVVVLACHMGYREAGDDFANRIAQLAGEFPQVSVILGAHTHQAVEVQLIRTVLYTQADHHGIHVGKVDITLDRKTRKPIGVRPQLARMQSEIALDPLVLSLASQDLEEVSTELDRELGELQVELEPTSRIGTPGGMEKLFALAIRRRLAAEGQRVAGVLHGSFLRAPVAPGRKTIRDAWSFDPYENLVVTAELTKAELIGVLQEIADLNRPEAVRNLVGFQVRTLRDGDRLVVTDIRQADGTGLEPGVRVRIAMNSYDAQSAGRQLLLLRAVVEQPSARRRLHGITVRNALIEVFRDLNPLGSSALEWSQS
jgi:2',3'-cyclic-nucleotide 2'-phosphodiesterase (5'-nucleotidase family)